jgi:hypothetical protein
LKRVQEFSIDTLTQKMTEFIELYCLSKSSEGRLFQNVPPIKITEPILHSRLSPVIPSKVNAQNSKLVVSKESNQDNKKIQRANRSDTDESNSRSSEDVSVSKVYSRRRAKAPKLGKAGPSAKPQATTPQATKPHATKPQATKPQTAVIEQYEHIVQFVGVIEEEMTYSSK